MVGQVTLGRRPSRSPSQRVADVRDDLADLTAQEDQGNDRDDRDEGEDQRVLGEALSLGFTQEPRERRATANDPVPCDLRCWCGSGSGAVRASMGPADVAIGDFPDSRLPLDFAARRTPAERHGRPLAVRPRPNVERASA